VATDRDIFVEAARLTQSGTPFVLATVISTKGSSPRDAGAKMIWRPDDAGVGGLTGTIGGGQFELLVAEAAARVFASRGSATGHYVLGAEAEQCCGGAMDVFLEYCGPRQRLVIFGAGHVSKELAEILKGSPLELVVVDDRPEWNSEARFPGALRIMQWDVGVRATRERARETLACVMTCSHETDFELLRKLLEPATAAPAFVGLIGSRSKRVCLFGRLVSSGIDEERVRAVQCPIGVGNTGKEPRMVAISMAAGILLEARKLDSGAPAARTAKGAAVSPPAAAHERTS
jgi:xanthine dehydrogenase accessory factor